MELAPVVLFVYARPIETKKTIESLSKNFLAKESDLIIFSDGPKNPNLQSTVLEVRKTIKSVTGFKSVKVIEREKNLGLGNSIITGITEVFNTYNKVIVLEEDLISSANFLDYINSSLTEYQNNEKVFSVTGYTYQMKIPDRYEFDNYFTPRCESLGWGTWKDRWIKADWNLKGFKTFLKNESELKQFNKIGADLIGMLLRQQLGKLDSWAVRWCYAHFRNSAFCSYPTKSKIVHIGEGGEATHVKNQVKILDTEIDNELKIKYNFSNTVYTESIITAQYKKMFNRSFLRRLRNQYYRLKVLQHR